MLSSKRIEKLWVEAHTPDEHDGTNHTLRFARLVEAAALENAADIQPGPISRKDLRDRARKAREAASE